MKHETFTAETIFNKRGKPPVIRIDCSNTGRINFSAEAVKLLGLKENMKLAFRVYEDDKTIIYFYEQATGIPLTIEKNRTKATRLAIYCRPLAERLLKHFGYKFDNKKTFDVSAERVVLPGTIGTAWFIQKENLHKPIKWKKHVENIKK